MDLVSKSVTLSRSMPTCRTWMCDQARTHRLSLEVALGRLGACEVAYRVSVPHVENAAVSYRDRFDAILLVDRPDGPAVEGRLGMRQHRVDAVGHRDVAGWPCSLMTDGMVGTMAMYDDNPSFVRVGFATPTDAACLAG